MKKDLENSLKINPCGRVYDFEWFPFMNSNGKPISFFTQHFKILLVAIFSVQSLVHLFIALMLSLEKLKPLIPFLTEQKKFKIFILFLTTKRDQSLFFKTDFYQNLLWDGPIYSSF
jgi:hypothetical protein